MAASKVLIIDDEPLTCQLVAKILKLQGYASMIVTDPSKIFEAIQSETPAVILMDYHLGGSHGIDILEELKSNDMSQSIPVIMTSGMDYEEETTAAGAEGFLQKPFDWKKLTALIREISPLL